MRKPVMSTKARVGLGKVAELLRIALKSKGPARDVYRDLDDKGKSVVRRGIQVAEQWSKWTPPPKEEE